MTRQEFKEMSYQDQWFHLVEWATRQYVRQPYLYYALHVLTQAYEHSRIFDATVMKDLHYEYDPD